jgi:predicted transposase/invertase (TIGR01784 family)
VWTEHSGTGRPVAVVGLFDFSACAVGTPSASSALMKKRPSHLHDIGYKHLLSNWRIFKSFLTSFVHEKWVGQVDYRRLQLLDKSFITKDFRKKESDLLYKARLKGGGEFYFYILLEHQSTVDFAMPLRLLLYISEIWQEVVRKQRKGRPGKAFRLPPVFPIVLYNGKQPWTAPQRFCEMVDRHEVFGDYVPDFRYMLVDVAHYDLAKLRRIRNAVAGVFMLDRDLSGTDLRERLREALDFLKREETEAILTFATWLRNVLLSHRGEEETGEILEVMKREFRSKKEAMAMIETLGKRLEEEARAEGALGAKRDDLLRVLRIRFGKPAVDQIEYYVRETTSIRKLDSLLKKAVTARTLDDIKFS